ncbi:MAG: SGNH/GDSL hydrolase family protein [Clostridia bacterium]
MKKFTDYYCATVLGTGNNNGIYLKSDTEYIFKSYYKLRAEGENTFRLFFINEVESTGNFRIGKKGDSYTIKHAYAAFSRDKNTEENKVDITFDLSEEKKVEVGERFSTDEFVFDYKKEGYMVLTFVVKTDSRAFLPSTNESASTGRIFENGKEIWSDNFSLRPIFIGVIKDKEKTVGFMGDSITQGTRTTPDAYEAWTHRIGNSFKENISFWNLGLGWARAYDGAENGIIIEKGAMCDEVFVCYGVNDLKSGGREADCVINDLKKIKENLKSRNENIIVHFLTVPPFNMSGYEEAQRKEINKFIKTTENYFDIAAFLEKDDSGSVIKEYMAGEDDAHPNGLGGESVFSGFEKWRESSKW